MSDHTSTAPSSRAGTPSPVPSLDAALIARLRADLAAATWTVERMDTLLSEAARAALMRDQRVPALVELRSPDVPADEANAALLTRLFILGSVETGEAIAAALPTLGVEGALELGILLPVDNAAANGGAVDADSGNFTYRAAFDLRPHSAALPTAEAFAPDGNPDDRQEHHWWVLSDLGEVTTGEPLHPDHVLGIGGATMRMPPVTADPSMLTVAILPTAQPLTCAPTQLPCPLQRHSRRTGILTTARNITGGCFLTWAR